MHTSLPGLVASSGGPSPRSEPSRGTGSGWSLAELWAVDLVLCLIVAIWTVCLLYLGGLLGQPI
jgi:hypothetical protein